MAKVIKFEQATPEKFGPQRVRKRKRLDLEKLGQLNLFSAGRVISLQPLSAFEEALVADEQGDNTRAKLIYLKAIDANDSTADAYCNLGIIEFKERNYPKAIDCFTRCLREEPRHLEAHYNLANLYSDAGNYALAKLHYQTAIEIAPDFPNSYFNMGLNLAMNSDFSEAITALIQYRVLTAPDNHQQADELIQKFRQLSEQPNRDLK